MAKNIKGDNTLPSSLTAYGGAGCSAIAISNDGIIVAAATETHINLYPSCSIWKPSITLTIPKELDKYNTSLNSIVCQNTDCLYKGKYIPYKMETKTETKTIKKKAVKATLQVLQFFGEKNEYLVGMGPYHFLIYQLNKMETKPIISMDSRFFGVETEDNTILHQASMSIFNIHRNHTFFGKTLSCIDFAFSIRPYVPTYYRVIFSERKKWWFVDCRWTTGLIRRDSMDDDVPYVFHNHDNTEYLRRDEEENKPKLQLEMLNNHVNESKKEKGENHTPNSTPNRINRKYNNTENEDEHKNYFEEYGEFKMDSDSETHEISSSSRSSDSSDCIRTGIKSEDSDNPSTMNEETDQLESDSNAKNNEDLDESKNLSEPGEKDSSGLEESQSHENQLFTGAKAVEKGVYFPFCLLARKVDLSHKKLKEYADVVKEGYVTYNQDFVMAIFVPLATVAMIELTIENKILVTRGRVKCKKLGETESIILSDTIVPAMNSKAHTLIPRKHGNVFTILFNDRFYVLKYTIPSVISKVLMREEDTETSPNFDKGVKRQVTNDTNGCGEKLTPKGSDLTIQNCNEKTPTKRYYNGIDSITITITGESPTKSSQSRECNSYSRNSAKRVKTINESTNGINEHSTKNNDCEVNGTENGLEYLPIFEKMENDLGKDKNSKKRELSRFKNNDEMIRYRIYTIEDDTTTSISVQFCHYDPVLRLRFTCATFDLSRSEGYLAICTNQSSEWGLQIFNTSSNTGVDSLRLVLDCSKCKGFTHPSWIPFTNKILVISTLNGELLQIEPKSQRNWVGLISNFTSIDKNVEYIEGEDIFDYSEDNQEIPPSLREFQLSKNEETPEEVFPPPIQKRSSLRYPFFNIIFAIAGFRKLKKNPNRKSYALQAVLHQSPPEVKDRFNHWIKNQQTP